MALLSALILSSVCTGQTSTPTNLNRVFSKGEKLAYQIRSHITAENRGRGLSTWLPTDLDINYNFTARVTEMRADGIAVMHYERPTMTQINGEGFDDSGIKTSVEKVNLDALLTLSPVNEILEQKDLSKKPSKPEDDELSVHPATQGAQAFFQPFISDIHRLSLFIGGVEDSLDFAPKLPLAPVKIGDTWKRTVGFQPQKLKGKDGKSAVQRLDYTYTYLGPMTSNGKKVLRVEAKLNFSTDLSEYFKQVLAEQASETNVKKIPLHFDSVIDFDLDPVTHDTLLGVGQTEGGYQVFLEETGDDPIVEERFKGNTTLELKGKRIVAASK
ncbi:MAG TPA: hypothetical protein VG944_21905 [Fimbriimonas sp.]|nr:hypothetical protein [Fimbriimonas sp.]